MQLHSNTLATIHNTLEWTSTTFSSENTFLFLFSWKHSVFRECAPCFIGWPYFWALAWMNEFVGCERWAAMLLNNSEFVTDGTSSGEAAELHLTDMPCQNKRKKRQSLFLSKSDLWNSRSLPFVRPGVYFDMGIHPRILFGQLEAMLDALRAP